MAAVTVEQVANMALGMLDEADIDSLDDNSKAGRAINKYFEVLRESELQEHEWAFAIFRARLSHEVDAPTSDEYGYAYLIPDDALRVLPLTDNGEAGGRRIPFKQEGDLILTNYAGPRLVRYIGNLTDPADWNSLFVLALAAKIAATIGYSITHKENLVRGAEAAYDKAIERALRINAILKSSAPASRSWSEDRGDWSDVR